MNTDKPGTQLDVTLEAFLLQMFGGSVLPLKQAKPPEDLHDQILMHFEERICLQSERLLDLELNDLVWALEWYFQESETFFSKFSVSLNDMVTARLQFDGLDDFLELVARMTCESPQSTPVLNVGIFARIQ